MRLAEMQRQLDENTRLTLESRVLNEETAKQGKENAVAIADLASKVEPITDAMASMAAGIRTLGRIGTFGVMMAKFGLVCAGLFAAGKLVIGGASWAEIVEQFGKVTGK